MSYAYLMNKKFLILVPVLLALIISQLPVPQGLLPYSWYYFSLFVGVIIALIIEPLPGAVIGLLGIVIGAVFSPVFLFSPEQLHSLGVNTTLMAFHWAVSGFSNDTVWLIFSAFMFALGYEKTGLGKRISLWLVRLMGARTLTLGYAISFADLLLAPFTPSNTARSAGTIYPVIRNLPTLYGSCPHDESARKIGAYLMWTAVSTTCVTSSFFLSALAPNLLSVALIEQQTGILIGWTDWFISLLPTGIILWSVTPLLGYYLYPPTEKKNDQVPVWAKEQLSQMGRLTTKEVILILLVVAALILWVGCSGFIDPAIASLVIISLMILTDIISWDDIVNNKNAWNTFFWFATLVALASGLSEVGFVRWAGDQIAGTLSGFGELFTILALVVLYFFLHYFFASGTAHVTALLPLMIAVVSQMDGVNVLAFSLLLCGTQGIMGVITPYATGPSPIYYGSGYIKPSEYWRLGFVFGAIYFLVYIAIEYPWLKYLWGGI